MKNVIKMNAIPPKSTVMNGFDSIDYYDTYLIKKKTSKSAASISNELMRLPGWVALLLRLRNSIVTIFGLKTDRPNPERTSFFTMIENNENEIVMGEDDKHLNFRASVMKDPTENTITLTTVVHFNNRWGRVYFFPVKPFHKIIMRTLLNRYLKKNDD